MKNSKLIARLDTALTELAAAKDELSMWERMTLGRRNGETFRASGHYKADQIELEFLPSKRVGAYGIIQQTASDDSGTFYVSIVGMETWLNNHDRILATMPNTDEWRALQRAWDKLWPQLPPRGITR